MASFSDISIRFSADLKEFSTQIQTAQREMKKFGAEMQKTGKTLSLALTAPLTALGTKSFMVFADFEDQLAKVKAITGAAGAEFDKLRQSAEDLGASTRFSASEVANLQLEMSKLGFSPKELLDATSGVLNLALATGENLSESASVAASTLRAFGLEADQTDRVVDVMAKSFSDSALGLNKFKVAMATVGPVAKSANMSLEDTTGLLAVLMNAGIEASSAGTGLRNVFLRLAKEGITLEQALGQIQNASNKNAAALELFGTAGATVGTVLAENYDAAKEFQKSFKDSAGAAKAMARVMDDTAAGSMAALKSATESLYIAVGNRLSPYVRQLAERLTVLMSKFKNLSPHTQKIIIAVGALAAGIGPLLLTIGFMAKTAIPGLISSFTALKAAILANPILTIAAVIAAATAALVLYNRTNNEATAVYRTLNTVRKEAADIVSKERSELDTLLKIAKDETRSKQEREKAIKAINEISPEYLGNITLEKVNTDEVSKAIESYIDTLDKKAKAQAALSAKQELFAKRLELETKNLGNNSWVQKMSNSFWEFLGVQTDVIHGIEDFNKKLKEGVESERMTAEQAENMRRLYEPYIRRREKELGVIDAQISALDAYIDVNDALSDSVKKGTGDLEDFNNALEKRAKVNAIDISGEGMTGIDVANEKLRTQIKILEATRKQYSETSAEYKFLTEQIEFHTKTIENAMQGFSVEPMLKQFDFAEFKLQQKMERTKEMASAISGAVAGSFENFTERMVGALGLADHGMQGFVKSLANTVNQLIAQMLAASIAESIKTGTAFSLSLGPGGFFAQPGVIAQMISGVMAAFASIPKFADGGIAYGPTLGIFGEYAGAKNNPEIIAPLDKLKSMIDSGGGEISLGLGTRIKGSDLEIIIDRAIRRKNRLS